MVHKRTMKRNPKQGSGPGHRPGSFMADKRTKRTKTRATRKRQAIEE